MTKLASGFVRCLLRSPRSLLGLGATPGISMVTCGGLAFDSARARVNHCAEVHGGEVGEWSEPVMDDFNQRNVHGQCDCGSARGLGESACPECIVAVLENRPRVVAVTGDYTKAQRLVATRERWNEKRRARRLASEG